MEQSYLIVALVIFAGVAILVLSLQRRQHFKSEAEKLATEARSLGTLYRSALEDLSSHNEYLSNSHFESWKSRHEAAITGLSSYRPQMAQLLSGTNGSGLRELHHKLTEAIDGREARNICFIEQRLIEDKQYFDTVEARPLTLRQREAIATDEDTTIVVAGAGTGKTSVIVGKVGYLLRHNLARPDQMLVMAYNRDAAEELRQRMTRLGGTDEITIQTFHAFGRSVIGAATGKVPDVHRLATDDVFRKRFITDTVKSMLKTGDVGASVRMLFTDFLDEPPSTTSASIEEAYELVSSRALELAKSRRCLQGDLLKSRQEVKIANWLTLNGIAWEYERPYKVDLSDSRRRGYRPDFYLPEFDIYIEHFGIQRDGSTAPGISSIWYQADIKWKRSVHARYGTSLVETYSYDDFEGILTRELAERLSRHGVYPRELTQEELDKIFSDNNRAFGRFVGVVDQFLSVFRGSGKTWDELVDKANSERDSAFLRVMRKVVDSYMDALREGGDIDYDDMITLAREAIRTGAYPVPFTHIIVDEFQDITPNRFGLIQDIRQNASDGRVFVVGDDWQSIYRFAGSDVSISTQLPKYAGETARVDLDQAFRYPQPLLEASTAFITKNPNQLRKKLQSDVSRTDHLPITVISRSDDNANAALSEALEIIKARHTGEQELEIFILSRYNFSLPKNLGTLKASVAKQGMNLEAITAHKSKGREADYVIIQDLKRGDYGFPSEISDDPVMDMVLTAADNYPFAEERRLFYVAMTRAKRGVFLCVPSLSMSVFLEKDLLSDDMKEYVEVIGPLSSSHDCPSCSSRSIVWKFGDFKPFWGCSNWPQCDGGLVTCGECNKGAFIQDGSLFKCSECDCSTRLCPRCKTGALVKRVNRNGQPFIGCSEWGPDVGCKYTENLQLTPSA